MHWVIGWIDAGGLPLPFVGGAGATILGADEVIAMFIGTKLFEKIKA